MPSEAWATILDALFYHNKAIISTSFSKYPSNLTTSSSHAKPTIFAVAKLTETQPTTNIINKSKWLAEKVPFRRVADWSSGSDMARRKDWRKDRWQGWRRW